MIVTTDPRKDIPYRGGINVRIDGVIVAIVIGTEIAQTLITALEKQAAKQSVREETWSE